MKFIIMMLAFFSLVPTLALADFSIDFDFGRGRDRGRDRDRGRADYCVARDNGWEEHWSGHSSCGECMRKHGRCTESCYEKEYRVVVSGIVDDRRDRREREEDFIGHGRSEWEAEDRAYEQCRWNRAYNCRVKSRDTQDREVSSRSCR